MVSLVIHSLLVIYPQVFHHFCTERAAFSGKIKVMSSSASCRFQSHFRPYTASGRREWLAGVIHISPGPITTAIHLYLYKRDGYNSSRGCGNVDNCPRADLPLGTGGKGTSFAEGQRDPDDKGGLVSRIAGITLPIGRDGLSRS